MKTAKVLLIVIGTFSLIGGALAYKSSRSSVFFYVMGTGPNCTVKTSLNYTFDLGGTSTTHASTASAALACPQITVRPIL